MHVDVGPRREAGIRGDAEQPALAARADARYGRDRIDHGQRAVHDQSDASRALLDDQQPAVRQERDAGRKREPADHELILESGGDRRLSRSCVRAAQCEACLEHESSDGRHGARETHARGRQDGADRGAARHAPAKAAVTP